MPTFDTPGDVSLDVATLAGQVTIATWDEPRVEVEVTPMRGDDASRLAAEETRIEATERSGRHVILVHVPKREGRFAWLGRGPELHIAIRCPEGADAEIASQSADTAAHGRLGDVAVKSASGDALVHDTTALTFTTASGDLSAGTVSGRLSVKSASGDVDVAGVGGVSNVNTVSGDVRIGESGDGAAVTTVSGDVDIEATQGSLRVNAVSGDVSVAARTGLSLWIDAQSVSGSVTSDLDVGEAPGDGTASAELRLRSVSGDIRIRRAPARVG